MRGVRRLAFVSFLIAVGALRADLPTPEVFAVVVDGEAVSTALVYHWNAVVRGRDPKSGETVTAEIPEWHRLEIDGERYVFHLRSAYDRGDPFAPAWTLVLDGVGFSWPATAHESRICRERPTRLELRLLPDVAPNCSGMLDSERDRCDDCDNCAPSYGRNYHPCPELLPALENPVEGPIEPFERLVESGRAQVDRREHDVVLRACSEGDREACGLVFSRYAEIHPGGPEALCDQRVGEREIGCPRCADERECAFGAFFEAVTSGCRPPACEARYLWGGRIGAEIEDPVWRSIPRPFPVATDPRLDSFERP